MNVVPPGPWHLPSRRSEAAGERARAVPPGATGTARNPFEGTATAAPRQDEPEPAVHRVDPRRVDIIMPPRAVAAMSLVQEAIQEDPQAGTPLRSEAHAAYRRAEALADAPPRRIVRGAV